MAIRFDPAQSAVIRCSIGAFNGYSWANSAHSGASLFKRNTASNWHGIHVIDDTTADRCYPLELNPSNQAEVGHAGLTWTSTQTFNDTTNWMIVGHTWSGAVNAWTYRWKIGAGSWNSEVESSNNSVTGQTAGSGWRHLIGNNFGLTDDADFDWVCTGHIKSDLGSGLTSLDMTSIASWDAVFTGANAWLVDGQATSSRTDRTGNGGNEVSRSAAGLSLVSDPPGWSWGGAAATSPVRRRRPPRGLTIR